MMRQHRRCCSTATLLEVFFVCVRFSLERLTCLSISENGAIDSMDQRSHYYGSRYCVIHLAIRCRMGENGIIAVHFLPRTGGLHQRMIIELPLDSFIVRYLSGYEGPNADVNLITSGQRNRRVRKSAVRERAILWKIGGRGSSQQFTAKAETKASDDEETKTRLSS